MCPYYKNKQVFNEFNEIVEAFGGKPMTEDEFKSRDLRNQRSGQDLIAMEAAYQLWDKNNGNALDKAPNGKDSTLFNTLLKITGSRSAAIAAKSKVYSSNFINWFGDWLSVDNSDVSQIVDENGEPLVVYHHTDDSNLQEFRTDFDNYFSRFKNGTKHAIFFTTNSDRILDRKYTIPVFLNLKTPFKYHGTKDSMHEKGTSYTELVNSAESVQGAVFTGLDDNKLEDQTVLVAYNSNQIKSAVNNNGNFSTTDNNINAQKTPIINFTFLQKFNDVETFGKDLSSRLSNGETASSKDIVSTMLNADIFEQNTSLAQILQNHDIPVMYGETDFGILAVTVTKDGGSYVVINKNALNNVSRRYFATTILHEIIHAVTVDAVNNPKTAEDYALQKASGYAFNILNKIFKESTYNRYNFDQGFYALSNEREFAAIFMTDEHVRDAFYREAKKYDSKVFNRVINAIKKLINAAVRVFVNKNVFNTSSVEVISKYEQVLRNYVYNKTPIYKGNLSKKMLKTMYSEVNDDVANAERIDLIAKAFRIETGDLNTNAQLEEYKKLSSFEDISMKLSTRLLSIKTADLDPNVRSQEIEFTKTAIELLNSANVAKIAAIQSILISAGSYIHQRLREVRNKQSMSAKEIRFALHSDFALYEQVLGDFNKFLKNAEDRAKYIEEYNRLKEDRSPEMTNDIVEQLVSTIDNTVTACRDGRELMEQYRRDSDVDALAEIGMQVNSPTIGSYLNAMFSPKAQRPVDMLSLEHSFGAADAVRDESIRLVAHMVKQAKDNAHFKSIDKAVKILTLQKELNKKSQIQLLYELDQNKRRTGYLIRKRNYGQFYQDYDKFLVQLNKSVAEKYNIQLSADNRVAPDDKEARKAWQKGKNEWLSLHCDRQYTKEYYDAWSEVSHQTRMALKDINNHIYSMTNRPDIIDPDTGEPHYENFSDEDWNKLQALFEQKRSLRSWYKLDGQKKAVGTPEYDIAKELNELHDKLYKNQKLSKNEKGWLDARNKVISNCGGVDEYNKWIRGEDSSFDGKTFEKWESRNTRWEFIENDEGVAEVFAQIQRELAGFKPYYGKEYEDISKQINQMLAPFYRPNGELDANGISETLKNKIKTLLKEQSKIRKRVLRDNPVLSKQVAKYGSVFNKYIEFIDTEQFKTIKANLMSQYSGMPELYSMVLSSYGTSRSNPFTGFSEFRPYRWYQRMQAKDKLAYMEPKPGDAWIEKSNNASYINDQFDELENTTYVPKMKILKQDMDGFLATTLGIKLKQDNESFDRYDNREKYNEVTKEGSALKDYYDEIKNTIQESNALQTNRPSVDNYLLPQVIGSFWQQIRSHSFFSLKGDSAWGVIWRYILEALGKSNENDKEEMFGMGADLSDTDETGAAVEYKYDPFKDTYSQSMADGSAYRALPQFYTRKLKDPSRISSDLSGIVLDYYNMSQQFHEKSKITDQCELILEELKNSKFRAGNLGRKALNLIGGTHGDSNTYLMAREWVDANLYDIKKVVQKVGGVNVTKFASSFSRWTTSVNLGLNPKVAATGALTTGWTHIINALTGQKYDVWTATKAGFATLYHIGKNLFGARLVGDQLSNDKQMLLMEMCDLSNQFSKKIHNTQRNRLLQVVNQNWIFGMMSSLDYLMKSQIMTSVMMSYRYVDGKFITKDDIRMNQYLGGNDRSSYVERQIEKWEQGACLYDVLYAEDHKIKCKDEYKHAFEQIKHIVVNRAQKYSEHADGMATAEQKAMITRGIVGSFLLIHRQYLPLMIQERVGNTVYDYDTQQMKNGQFRRVVMFIQQLLLTNAYASGVAGAGVTTALGLGPLGAILGGVGLFVYSKHSQKTKGSKTLKQVFHDTFNDFSNRESNIESQMNRYAFKQIAWELGLFNLVLSPVINMICFYADDHKDDKLLQAIAYWLRGLQWEAYTPYRLNDIFQNFKSPSAALSMVDRFGTFFNALNTSLVEHPLMWLMSLCGSPLFDQEYNQKVDRGTYKGDTKQFKSFMKITPGKNIYEQSLDSYNKRKYAEQQLYMIDKKEQKNSLSYGMYNYLSK